MKHLIEFNNFELNEGKLANVERFGNYVKYNSELFPNLNIPKPYIGRKDYRYRVLASEGDMVKPINFGSKTKRIKPITRLNKKYWDNLPYYR